MEHKGAQNYSYEAIRAKINTNATEGGPPINGTIEGTGCALFDQVQAAVDNCCGSEGTNNNSLCKAAAVGELAFEKPISCMLDLITNHMYCGQEFTQQQMTNAYNTYVDVTGFKPFNLPNAFKTLNNQTNAMISFNAFYIYGPIALLMIIVVWLLAGFQWINWVVALYFTILIIVVLYGFSIAYRIHAQSNMNKRFTTLETEAHTSQQAYENSISKIPNAMLAVACSLTASGGTGYWECNPEETPCPPCVNGTRPVTNACFGCPPSKISNQYIEEEEIPMPIRRNRGPR